MFWLDPEDEFRRMRRGIRLLFPSADLRSFESPLMDVSEEQDEVVVSIDLPGLSKEDIDVEVDENVVTIKAKKKEEAEEKKKNYYYRERSYKGFFRKFTLPTSVDPKTVSASYKNGVLELKIKKLEKKKRRTIVIK